MVVLKGKVIALIHFNLVSYKHTRKAVKATVSAQDRDVIE